MTAAVIIVIAIVIVTVVVQVVVSSMQIKHLLELASSLGEDFGNGAPTPQTAVAIEAADRPVSVDQSDASQPRKGEMVTVGLTPHQIQQKLEKRVNTALNKAMDVNFVVGEVRVWSVHPIALSVACGRSGGRGYDKVGHICMSRLTCILAATCSAPAPRHPPLILSFVFSRAHTLTHTHTRTHTHRGHTHTHSLTHTHTHTR